MLELKAGQKLWWVDREKQKEGFVTVADVTEDHILVWYQGRKYVRPYSVIGEKLFLSRQLNQTKETKSQTVSRKNIVSKTPVKLEYVPIRSSKRSYEKVPSARFVEEKVEQRFFEPAGLVDKSCDTCALCKNGNCTSLRNQLCEEYRTLQRASPEERNAYPQYGDATAIRKKDRKHFE